MVGTGAVTVTKLPDLQTWGGPRQAPEISYEETPKRGTCGRPPQGPLKHPLISAITLEWMNGWTPPLIRMYLKTLKFLCLHIYICCYY